MKNFITYISLILCCVNLYSIGFVTTPKDWVYELEPYSYKVEVSGVKGDYSCECLLKPEWLDFQFKDGGYVLSGLPTELDINSGEELDSVILKVSDSIDVVYQKFTVLVQYPDASRMPHSYDRLEPNIVKGKFYSSSIVVSVHNHFYLKYQAKDLPDGLYFVRDGSDLGWAKFRLVGILPDDFEGDKLDILVLFKFGSCGGQFYQSLNVENSSNLTDNDAKEVKIYPNPTSDYIIVEGIDKQQVVRAYITSINGVEYNISDVDYISTSSMPLGVYFLIIETKTAKYSERLIIK